MEKYPRASVRIELAAGKRLGPGKVRLLELVGKEGSISAAARAMGMSYRRAWLLIEESNRLFKGPLVASVTGGTGGGGARLTALGERVIAAYRSIESKSKRLVSEEISRFPGLSPKRGY